VLLTTGFAMETPELEKVHPPFCSAVAGDLGLAGYLELYIGRYRVVK
jgi:hypothetical protein